MAIAKYPEWDKYIINEMAHKKVMIGVYDDKKEKSQSLETYFIRYDKESMCGDPQYDIKVEVTEYGETKEESLENLRIAIKKHISFLRDAIEDCYDAIDLINLNKVHNFNKEMRKC